MTRQELQTAIKSFKSQSLTDISTNSKTQILQAEYNKIVESEKQFVISMTVFHNNEFIRVTSTGLRGKTLISHFCDGVIPVNELLQSSYVTTQVLAASVQEETQMITVIATTADPLNNQLTKLTGDGWNVFDWHGNLMDSNIIRHKKTGMLVQVL